MTDLDLDQGPRAHYREDRNDEGLNISEIATGVSQVNGTSLPSGPSTTSEIDPFDAAPDRAVKLVEHRHGYADIHLPT